MKCGFVNTTLVIERSGLTPMLWPCSLEKTGDSFLTVASNFCWSCSCSAACLGCKHSRRSLSAWCACVTLACGYMATSVPSLQRILVCQSSQLAGLAFHLQLQRILLLLLRWSLFSPLVLAKVASATFVQSRAELALMSVRNVMERKTIRGKVESENMACEAWLSLWVTGGRVHHLLWQVVFFQHPLLLFFLPPYQCYTAFRRIPSPCLRCFQTSAHPQPLPTGSSFYVCSLSLTVWTEQNSGVGFLTGSDSERGFVSGRVPGDKTHCPCTLARCQAFPGHSNFPLEAAACQGGKTHWKREEAANERSLC